MPQRELLEDHLANTLSVLQNFIILEPQHTEPFAIEEERALAVVFGHVGVLTPVNLDNQFVREAYEIDDVLPDRLLPAKLEAGQLATR